MAKRWRIHQHDSERIANLARAADIAPVVAQLLLCRGIACPSEAQSFLAPKLTGLRAPEELPGVIQATEVIWRAIQAKQRIVVYGDYDVDGMTAASLLWKCLRLLGAEASYYVPHRLDEGYGLHGEALTKLAADGAKMVITVDCGIGSVAEAELAKQLGLQLVITDHHELGPSLPDAAAIVHPRLPGSSYPFAGLCGAGVALKLAWALCQQASGAKRVSEPMRNFLLEAVGLAALGTIADVVPLVDENRVLVTHGLLSLKERCSTGLTALFEVTGLDKQSRIDCDHVGFTIAPRLNAAGRLGQARLGVDLLTTTSRERAVELAQYIHQLNESRQALERSVYLAAHKQAIDEFDPANNAALVLAGRGWHPGVIGIVAGRLAEKLHRPVVLLSLDELGGRPAQGSARSIPGFNLHEALSSCAHHFESFGGHAAAAGLKIEEAKIEAFRDDLCEFASAATNGETTTPELWIDAEAPLGAFNAKVVGQIEQLSPFGQGNPRPMLCASGVTLEEPPRRIGGGRRHLSLRVAQHGSRMRAVYFGGGDDEEKLAAQRGPFSIAFRPVINEFNGRRNVELQLADWRANGAD
jgi:single-stranded-DNA-specific exonuclease